MSTKNVCEDKFQQCSTNRNIGLFLSSFHKLAMFKIIKWYKGSYVEYFLVGICIVLTLKTVSFYEQTKHLNASHSFTVLTFFWSSCYFLLKVMLYWILY